jgi:hypothetical protein
LKPLVFAAGHLQVRNFSKAGTLEKNSTDRSMSETVNPTASTDFTSCADISEEQRTRVKKRQKRTLTLTLSLKSRGKYFVVDLCDGNSQRRGENFPSPPRGEGEGEELIRSEDCTVLFID